jgi:hypothetical protein
MPASRPHQPPRAAGLCQLPVLLCAAAHAPLRRLGRAQPSTVPGLLGPAWLPCSFGGQVWGGLGAAGNSAGLQLDGRIPAGGYAEGGWPRLVHPTTCTGRLRVQPADCGRRQLPSPQPPQQQLPSPLSSRPLPFPALHPPQIDVLSPAELATLLWVLVQLNHSPDQIFVAAWCKSAAIRLHAFSAASLCLSLHALGALAASGRLDMGPGVVPGRFVDVVMPRSMQVRLAAGRPGAGLLYCRPGS